MNTEQQPAAELIEKPAVEVEGEKLIVPEEWKMHFQTIGQTLTEMDSWKTMTIEKDGITKVTAKRVIAKKLRVKIEDVRKTIGRTIMARKETVDAFAESLKDAVSAVEICLEVIEKDHKAKVKAEAEQREAEAAKILNERIAQLESLGYIPADVAALATMTPFQFQQLLDARRRIFEAAERTKVRVAELLAIGPDDIREGSISMMSDAEFATYLTCHRVVCECRERERAEAEQSERERVEKMERELEESRQRIAELEAATIADRRRQLSEVSDSQISDDMLLIMSDESFRDLLAIAVERRKTPVPIVNSNGDTMLPQLGEVIQVPLTGGLMLPADVEISQSGVTLLPPGHDVQTVADTVRVSLNLRMDDSELYGIGNKLELSADAFRMFMQLSGMEVSAVFVVDKATGIAKLINVNGLTINGNEAPF